ncbi:MAG: 6-carboxytetrahydropterin synthase QueD [Candidatus Omnitrophota bacterium]|nr:6-carboxytetrahydropterin synthase QueD [Candidatus Omnitrophota bacterium]
MYKIEVFENFSAAHRLRGYKGKCENIHGHNWKVGAAVSSDRVNKTGIVIDFKEVKKKLKDVLNELDHKNLNSLGYFKKINPTSENLAKLIYEKLKKTGLPVSSVSVWEADDSKATYTE